MKEINGQLSVSQKFEKIEAYKVKGYDAEGKFKINADCVLYYMQEECYRENIVSYTNMYPILEHTVPLEDADYILYMHMYARCEDFSDYVVTQLKELAKRRKDGAEIIVLGKAANAEKFLKDIPNMTFWGDNFVEKLGKRFGYDMKEQYIVYDDHFDWLAIWPVNGCLQKCKFCRRCFMDIKFESQSLEFLKSNLDFISQTSPEKMRKISLRAENLTEYGIDIYGKQMLHEVIDLINSYDAVEEFAFPIGLSIGEITPEILDSLCRCKKITNMSLNLEVGSDKLLKLIGKPHTREKAIYVYKKIRDAHPETKIQSTVMIGFPTEDIGDMWDLAKLIEATGVDKVMCNYYISSNNHPLAKLPQLTESCRENHLKNFISYIKKCDLPEGFNIKFYRISKGQKSRKEIKSYMALEKYNKQLLHCGLLPVHFTSKMVLHNKKFYMV